jgi:hypothetical protein
MDVSPNALRREVVQNLREVNDLLAKEKDREEVFTRAILLGAKTQCLLALVQLNEQGRGR